MSFAAAATRAYALGMFAEAPLVELGRVLQRAGYRFVTPTPETHRRVLARGGEAKDVRDALGWNRPFRRSVVPREVALLLDAAGALRSLDDDRAVAQVRFSTLDEFLFVHSAYPTLDPASVFFGPDTYRFVAMAQRALRSSPRALRLVDVGCGSGAGGIALAHAAQKVVLADINDAALSLTRVNVALAGLDPASVEVLKSDVLDGVAGAVDLVLANPPYLVDAEARAYRDGGGDLGAALSVRIAGESIARLAPGGRLVLYTGTAIVGGRDTFLECVRPLLDAAGAAYTYETLDPDVFGEELDRPGYAAVERIAVVGLYATAPA
ncbi:MAG: putative N(5)-glutamine methyltransferase PrmC [Myxococcaceae bacterium]|nr:putative N(5)-glutamine methyltransferase PrmC [Myxococcaceae bacterium]